MKASKIYTFEEALEKNGRFVYTNVGNSMMPLIRQGKDLIEISKKGTERCKKYDVILYRSGEQYILHRIIKVLPNGYLVAGDHNSFVERDITDEQILGIMTRLLRNGKTITPKTLLYKIYYHIWSDLYPIRMVFFRATDVFRAACGKVRMSVKK